MSVKLTVTYLGNKIINSATVEGSSIPVSYNGTTIGDFPAGTNVKLNVKDTLCEYNIITGDYTLCTANTIPSGDITIKVETAGTDATATAADILSGKQAQIGDGSIVEGTIQIFDGTINVVNN